MTSKTHASVVAAWNRLWHTEKNRTTTGTTDRNPIMIQEQSRNKQANQTNDNVNRHTQSIHQTLCSEPKKLRRSKHHRRPPHEVDNDGHTDPDLDAINTSHGPGTVHTQHERYLSSHLVPHSILI
jgi:hypothetical protein